MGVFGFPRSHRLRKKKEFNTIFQKSFRLFGNFFILRMLPCRKHSQLGIIIPKKFGNSPYRSRIRRLIREHFRLSPPALPIQLLYAQSRSFPNFSRSQSELKKISCFLGDKYFLLAHLAKKSDSSLKGAQLSQPMSILAKAAFYAVLIYKKYISQSLKPSCRFTPSCSEYAMDAFRIYGFFKGLAFTINRLLRCHPFCKGGYDPLPYRKKSKPQK